MYYFSRPRSPVGALGKLSVDLKNNRGLNRVAHPRDGASARRGRPMQMSIFKHRDIRRKLKEVAIGAVALLAITGPMLSTAAADDEVLTLKFATEVNTTNFT